MRSLKGAVADMACYMGPTAGVSEILESAFIHDKIGGHLEPN